MTFAGWPAGRPVQQFPFLCVVIRRDRALEEEEASALHAISAATAISVLACMMRLRAMAAHGHGMPASSSANTLPAGNFT